MATYEIYFKVTTQISTSRELNRVSPNNIAEQSTRYVYEMVLFVVLIGLIMI